MTESTKRTDTLAKLAAGEISIEEADAILEQIEYVEDHPEAASSAEQAPENETGAEDELPPASERSAEPQLAKLEGNSREYRKFRWVWVWILIAGLTLTFLGGIGMASGVEKAGLGWGFWLSWIPLLLGIGVVTLALASSRSLWLHVRVNTGKDEWPRRIHISLPIPTFLLRLGAQYGNFNIDGVGKIDAKDLTAILKSIQDSEIPLTVHVDEGGGEKVEVFIGRM